MTNHDDNSSNPPMNAGPEPQASLRRGRRYLTVAAIVLAAGLTGAVASQAFSESGYGRGWHGPWHGHWMGRFGSPIDPACAADRVDRMVRHLTIEIDATAEQEENLRSIVRSAVQDLLPMREKARAARERARALLTQATIDRAAIEAFRAEQIKLADEASKRLAQALVDAAEILTPEQRQQIAEHMARRRGHWRRWRRG